jgi:hypothetical protein
LQEDNEQDRTLKVIKTEVLEVAERFDDMQRYILRQDAMMGEIRDVVKDMRREQKKMRKAIEQITIDQRE